MNPCELHHQCQACSLRAWCGMNRRQFINRCAVCFGAAGLLSVPTLLAAPQPTRKTKIRVVYALHATRQDRPDWPNQGFDFAPVMAALDRNLSKHCKEFEFVTCQAAGEAQAKAILEQDKTADIDGYLVFQMNCWNRVVQPLAASGKPVLYADFQFGGSGGFLVYTAAFIRAQSPNVAFVASSRAEDLIAAVKCFRVVAAGGSAADFVAAVTQARHARTSNAGRLSPHRDQLATVSPEECLQRLKQSRILAVRDQSSGPLDAVLGIPVELVSFAEISDAWKAADHDQAHAIAEAWRKNANVVVGVSPQVLDDSAAMYLGMKAVMNKHGANAISVNCLGGFYGGHLPAYPCLGFHELNNQGLVGGCECDLRSAAAMLLFSALTNGRPGFISDPVLDTSRRQIIYAHCVAPNRVFGPKGTRNPYQILSHSEDRQGASVRSLLPVGYMTTSVQVSDDRKEILLHRAVTVANYPEDRACRTKLGAVPLGDFEKLFTAWDRWGWHRVTCYGDLKGPVQAVADSMGWKVVEEA